MNSSQAVLGSLLHSPGVEEAKPVSGGGGPATPPNKAIVPLETIQKSPKKLLQA